MFPISSLTKHEKLLARISVYEYHPFFPFSELHPFKNVSFIVNEDVILIAGMFIAVCQAC